MYMNILRKWIFLKPVQVEALKNYSKDNVPEAKRHFKEWERS